MEPSRSFGRRLESFLAMDIRAKTMMAEALLALAAARLLLRMVPFSHLSRRFGDFVPPDDARVTAVLEGGAPDARDLARQVRDAVGCACRNAPFEAVCLPQAMAAHFMLKRRGVACVMRFGAGPSPKKPLELHAWLDAAGVKVTGYPLGPGLAEIACFV